ncbi:MAG: sigma-70 family RNA polymerase sigma factor [Polyangiaceae bacterium]|nr:sigma-70 family RNA polymerase sigma factor [Polyangiaceae bacterium]
MDQDHELLRAWAAGDRGAGAQLVERYYDTVARFFANKAADAAEDLVQRTFLACTESMTSLRKEGSLRAYLLGVARNVLYEHIRGKVRDGREVDFGTQSIVDLSPGASTLVDQHAQQRQLLLAIQRIPLESQLLLEMFYWEELSVDEVAEALAIPPGTVKSRLHRAREQLRDALGELPPAGNTELASAQALLDGWLARMREISE